MKPELLLDRPRVGAMDLAPLRSRALVPVMPIDVRRPSFDRLTMSLHWVTLFLVLALFATAWLQADVDVQHGDLAPVLLQIHRSFGVTIWILTALRLAWRLTRASLPPFPAQMARLHRATVKLSEYGLYALVLAQPATGLLATFSGGRPFALFVWQVPALMLRHEVLRAWLHFSHQLGAWALAALVLGHAAAALFHHFVLRDDVLECMAPVMRRHGARRDCSRG
jgi:cytochrome b561